MVLRGRGQSGRGEKDVTFFASAAKCYASDVAMEVTTDAVQLFGGAGYTQDFRRADDAGRQDHPIYEGTNQIQRVVMARRVLKRRRVSHGTGHVLYARARTC